MPGVGTDNLDPDGKLDTITKRLIGFANETDEADEYANIHWAMAQWISDMVYGWSTSRYDRWEERFVHCLIDVAELGDVLQLS